MSKPFSNHAAESAGHAAAILRAWVSSDERAFHHAVDEMFAFCSADSNGYEEEHVELLRTVGAALRNRPMTADSEAMVHLCLNLLIHITTQSWQCAKLPEAALAAV